MHPNGPGYPYELSRLYYNCSNILLARHEIYWEALARKHSDVLESEIHYNIHNQLARELLIKYNKTIDNVPTPAGRRYGLNLYCFSAEEFGNILYDAYVLGAQRINDLQVQN